MSRQSLCFRMGLFFATSCVASAAEPDTPRFETHVRPILKAHCWQCHGEEEELRGELDTRLARFLIKGGESGPAIVPGRHTESLLFDRASSGEMPPGSKTLSVQDLAILARWIDSGARTVSPEPKSLPREGAFTNEEQQHWAFQPIQREELPFIQHTHQLRSPIDAFLLARLAEEELNYSPEADRPTLIRRLSFNLHGLPPTPAAVDRFIADRTPGAYERLVDRMLASPAYGERWARHWLDIAGYADSDGVIKEDPVRPWAWKYRDYVIRAFNSNKPWDEFLVEQLAGDELLTPPYKDLTPDQADCLIATGFLRMPPDGTSGSNIDQDAARNQVMAEVIKVVSTSLLGLSIGCAQCHPHRYDPITHTDYYRIRALFEPAYDWKNWRSPNARLISQWSKEDRKQAEVVDNELAEIATGRDAELDAAVEKAVEKRILRLPAEIRPHARIARETPDKKRTEQQKELIEEFPFLKVTRGSLQEIELALKKEIVGKWDALTAAASRRRPAEDYLMCLTEIPNHVSPTLLFARGDFNLPRQPVTPGGLSVLSTNGVTIPDNNPDLSTTGRRLAWAQHLTSGHHPLVARVLVNRFWMHHFGRGLVATPANFGMQSKQCSHPELLDWLASEFMDSDWNLKHLHRLVVTSRAYRQTSVRSERLNELDPDNRLLGRMSVRRLEAEVLRDSLLALSGRFVQKMYGPPAPVSLDAVGQRVIVSANQYDSTGRLLRNVAPVGEDAYRRTIYMQVRRSMPLGILQPFDPPAVKPNCELRTVSTNAPQSLMMMNDPFVLKQVQFLAVWIDRVVGKDPGERFVLAWRSVFGRAPTDNEKRFGLEFLEEDTAAVRSPNSSKSDDHDSDLAELTHLCHALVSSNGFLYVD